MRALICTRYAERPELVLGEAPEPAPGPGEVLVAVRAAGLNFFDLLMVQGRYQRRPEVPFTPWGRGCRHSVGARRRRRRTSRWAIELRCTARLCSPSWRLRLAIMWPACREI